MDDLTHHQKISKAIREDDFDELQTLLSAPQTKKVDLANILASALQSDRRRAAKEVYNQFKRQSRLSLIVDWAQNKSYATPLKALCYWVAHHNEVYVALKFAASTKNGEMVENLLPLLGSSAVALDILSMGINQNDPIIVSCALKHVSSHSEDDVDAAWSHVLRMKSVEMLDEALGHFPNSRLPPVSLHHLADPVFKDRWSVVLLNQPIDDVTSDFLRGAVLQNSWGALQYVATRADIQSTNVLEWVREYQVVEIVEPLMDLFTKSTNREDAGVPARQRH